MTRIHSRRTAIAAVLLVSLATAQDPRAELLLDIRQDLYDSQVESEFLRSGAWSWFVADTDGSHRLYRTDGTPAGTALFADLDPSSRMSILLRGAAGGRLFFSARAVRQGQPYRLWVCDGTVAGTRPLQVGTGGVSVRELFEYGNRVVFLGAETGSTDIEPWVSDGTPTGTQRLADIVPGGAGSFVSEFHALVPETGSTANRLWFAAFDPASRRTELWSTDGSPAGTRREVTVPAPLSGPSGPTALGPGLLVATATDPSPFTTRLLRIEAGVGVSELPIPQGVTVLPESRGTAGRAFLPTLDASAALVTDGTATGTRAVALQGPAKDGESRLLADRSGDLILAYASSGSWQLARVTAGTDTAIALGTLPGKPVRSRQGPVWIGERLALLCETGPSSPEVALFAVDPRIGRGAASQRLVAGEVRWLAGHFGRAMVAARDPGTTRRLPWVSDGTAAGTQLLADLPGALLPFGSSPSDFVDFGRRTVFLAHRSDVGREPWITDGTPQGTFLLGDLEPGRRDADIDRMLEVGDELWVVRNGRIEAVSGPLLAGATPRLVTRLDTRNYALGIPAMVAFGDGVLVPGRELQPTGWFPVVLRIDRDGTMTSLPSASAYLQAVLPLGERALVIGIQANGGWDLWLTDGTANGNQRIGIVPTPSGARVMYERFADAVWINTGAGTFVATAQGVTPFAPWTGNFQRMVVAGDRRLYGLHADGTLRATDGTATGTTSIALGPGVDTQTLTALGARLLLVRGNELVVTDGTSAGTNSIADLGNSDDVQIYATGKERAFVAGGDPARGNPRRLWLTDGTVAGTRPIQELSLPYGPFVAKPFGHVAGGRLFLAVDDPQLGSEPYVLDPGAAQHPIGVACAGAGTATPRLHASNDPRLGAGLTLEATSDGARSGWIALGLPALRPVAIATSRCAWRIEPGSVTAVGPFTTNAGGTFLAPLQLPNDPALLGLQVVTQALFATGRGPLGVDLSPGLLLQIGR